MSITCIARTQPIEVSEYPKHTTVKHVWEISEGFFVYSDETENFSDNIYTSIHDAEVALNAYGDWLCYGPDESTIGETK